MTSFPIREPFVSKHIPKVSTPNPLPPLYLSGLSQTIIEEKDITLSTNDRGLIDAKVDFIPYYLLNIWKYLGSIDEILNYITPFAIKAEEDEFQFKRNEEIQLEERLTILSYKPLSPQHYQTFAEQLASELANRYGYMLISRDSKYYKELIAYLSNLQK